MNISTSLSQLSTINSKIDTVFHQLETIFPQILNSSEKTPFDKLKVTVSEISTGLNSESNFTETAASFSEKYSPVFTKLNEKITDLTSLDKMIAEVKEDSEQMELIALNAMVISVKSGEKGLAFSRITENLQRLSKDMFFYSDKLSEEESHLLEQINSLKTIFTGIINSQKSIASKDWECSSEIKKMVEKATPSISEISSEVDSIYPQIERTMTIMQKKQFLKNELELISSALNELNKHNVPLSGSDEELDYTCFAISVYEKIAEFFSKISTNLTLACSEFAGNWQQVIEIMEKTDSMRMDFESRFLNNHAFGNDNIARQMESIIKNHKEMITEFGKYHLVQKDLQANCDEITNKAKSIYSIFENLRPVMNRLHHVRILQQIEVSKNDAIKSVQDSVIDMDNLINSANASLDKMQEVLERFIQDTSSMLNKFTQSISSDNSKMDSLCNSKELVLNDLENGKHTVDLAFQNFTVLPDDFQKKCVVIQQNLQDFMRLNMDFSSIANEFEGEKSKLLERKQSLMNEKALQNWEIKNQKYLDSLAQI